MNNKKFNFSTMDTTSLKQALAVLEVCPQDIVTATIISNINKEITKRLLEGK